MLGVENASCAVKLPQSRRPVLMLVVFLVVVATPFAFVGSLAFLGELKEWRNRLPFDTATWKTSLAAKDDDPIRLRMVDDLLSHHPLRGMSRDEVASMLGTPPKTDYFRDYDFVYWLGPERGFISIDSEWLGIKFGRDGRVSDARLLRD